MRSSSSTTASTALPEIRRAGNEPNPVDETIPLELWPNGSACYRQGTAGAPPGTPDEQVPGFKGRTLLGKDGKYLAWRWLAPVKQYRYIGKFDHFLVAMGRM